MKKIILLTSICLLSLNVFSQSTICTENFDDSLSVLPVGWSASPNGWYPDSSNSSTGYTGASGLNNVVIKNAAATGVYSLVTKSISTIGYSNVKVSWAARHTINFPTSGSVIQSFDYSIDNGASWVTIPFTQNASNSIWGLINGATSISLPAATSNQGNLMFRWVANIVTSAAGGTYRIDDFQVQADLANATSTFIENKNLNFYCDGKHTVFIQNEYSEAATFNLFDISGKQVYRISSLKGATRLELTNLQDGIYFATLKTNQIVVRQKIQISSF